MTVTPDLAPVGAEATGVDPRLLDLLITRVRTAVEHGPLPSAQLAVARGGRLVGFECFGDTDPERRYVLQSVGRSVLAAVVWQVLDAGLLRLDERVTDVIPGFGTNGKDAVTVEHVLTHTAGFPFAPLGYPKMCDREQRLAAFGRWRLDYEPGTRLQFHLTSAAWVIDELVRRRTDLGVADYLATRIAGRLGLSLELGVPLEHQAATVAPMTVTDGDPGDEVDPWGPWYLSAPEVLAAGEPSHAMVGTAADVAMLFQAVAHSGLWSPGIVADATRSRLAMPPAGEQLYGGGETRVHMGLFVPVSGGTGGAWLPAVAPNAWGHGGAAYQLGFHDPDTDVSFALLSNGYPRSGYDYSRAGVAFMTTVATLAADLVHPEA